MEAANARLAVFSRRVRVATASSVAGSGVTGREPVFTGLGELVQVGEQARRAKRTKHAPEGGVILHGSFPPHRARGHIIAEQTITNIRAENFPAAS